MRQPVVDTLRLSDTLRKAGMEREQAEGVARALGKELGEHVAVQGDLDAGFQGVRSEMGLMRSELDARIDGLRSEMALMRSELDARIDGLRSEMALMRSELDARIDGLRSEMALMRSELEARIEEVRSSLDAKIEGVRADLKALNAKFNFGFGLLVAFLSVLVGIGLLNLNKPITAPPVTANAPLAAPASAALAPHPNPATRVVRNAASVEAGPVPPTPH